MIEASATATATPERSQRQRQRQRPRPPPPNFLEWSLQTFGEGITRHFMQPYNFKVWGIDPSRMSSDWIAGRVLTPSLDEVIEGSLQRGRRRHGPERPVRLSAAGRLRDVRRRAWPGGSGRGAGRSTLERTLVQARPEAASGRRSASRSRATAGPAARRSATTTLFPSVPLPDLIRAIAGAPEAVRQAAAGLPSTAVVCVNLGINREKVTEKHWIYYPEVAGQVHLPAHLRAVQRLAVHGAAGPQRLDLRDQPL